LPVPSGFTTSRLELRVATLDLLRAELESPAAFAGRLGLAVPPDWPPGEYDEGAIRWVVAKLEQPGARPDWWFYYVVRRAAAAQEAALVGCAGYKGPPDDSGTVEIGYSVLPGERRRGYASEAAGALVDRAFSHPGVRRVIAQTLPHLEPSIGVLAKCGFRLVGPGMEEGAILFELTRAEWRADF
jgi:RimJ/RimL family protein N-acetyltransferase